MMMSFKRKATGSSSTDINRKSRSPAFIFDCTENEWLEKKRLQ
jgi:hypothetical protein